MAMRPNGTTSRRIIKEERSGSDTAYAPVEESELSRAWKHKTRLRESVRRLAADAGFSAPPEYGGSDTATGGISRTREGSGPTEHDSGGPRKSCPQVKTPKYAGKAGWEAYHAQFELLAEAAGWTEEEKALQLALCLTDDALACLLLLNPDDRRDYGALVGALQRRFGQCYQPGVLRSELASRHRREGEPLRVLANDIESLTRRAYAHMPHYVQSELARDQFIRSLSPRELRIQTQLAHPRTLQEALETALEREVVGAGMENGGEPTHPVVRMAARDSVGQEKPAWAEELTELIRTVSLRPPRAGMRADPGPVVCWECGQTGHMRRRCPKLTGAQGNAPGPV